jgi:hypothetical protein
LAEIPLGRLAAPKAVGEWSVKDIIAHLTAYNRWFVRASEAYFRGELPPPDGSEGMDGQARNRFYHLQARDLPLDQVLAEWRRVYARLLEVVAAHTEDFLTQPQHLPGAPVPVEAWKLLRYDGYDHAREHAAAVRAWLASEGP